MNNIHKLVLFLKIIFIILLIIINIIPSFSTKSPLFIIVHDLLIIILCVYLIYLTFPLGRQVKVEMEKEDFLFIFIVCLMLLKTVDFREFGSSFRINKKTSDQSIEAKQEDETNQDTNKQ